MCAGSNNYNNKHRFPMVAVVVMVVVLLLAAAATADASEAPQHLHVDVRAGFHGAAFVPRNEQLKSIDARVVGGMDVTDPTKYPFVGGVTFRMGSSSGYSICTGSLISPSWVLTAGHCVDGLTDGFVRLGSVKQVSAFDCRSGTDPCRRIINSYSPSTYTGWNHDIGLVKLDSPVAYSANVQPACLNSVAYNSANNGGVTPAVKYCGFGLTSGGGSLPSILQESSRPVPILESSSCPQGDICLQSVTPATDACNGDSGSGVMHWGNNGLLVSVVSRGPANCLGGGIDTEVYAHLRWILSLVDEPVDIGAFTAARSQCRQAQTVSTDKSTAYGPSERVTVAFANMPQSVTLTVVGTGVAQTVTGATAESSHSGSVSFGPFTTVPAGTSSTFTVQARSTAASSPVIASVAFVVSNDDSNPPPPPPPPPPATPSLSLSKSAFSKFESVTGTYADMPESFVLSNGVDSVAFGGSSGSFQMPPIPQVGAFTLTAIDAAAGAGSAPIASVSGTVQAPQLQTDKSLYSAYEPVTGSVSWMPPSGCSILLPLANGGSARVSVDSASATFSLPPAGADAPTTAVQLVALDADGASLATSAYISFVTEPSITLDGESAVLPGDQPITGSYTGMPSSFLLRLDGHGISAPLDGPTGSITISPVFAGGLHTLTAHNNDAEGIELASVAFITAPVVRTASAVYSAFEPITGTYAGAAANVSMRVAISNNSGNSHTTTSSSIGDGTFTLAPVTSAVSAGGMALLSVDLVEVSTSIVQVSSVAFTVVGAQLAVDRPSFNTAQSITGTFAYLPPAFSIVLINSSTGATVATATVSSEENRYTFAPVSQTGSFSIRAINRANNAAVASVSVSVTALPRPVITLANSGQFVAGDNIRGTYSGFPTKGITYVYYQIGSSLKSVTIKGATGSFTLPPPYAVGTLQIVAARASGIMTTAMATLSSSVLGSATYPVPTSMVVNRSVRVGFSKFPTVLSNRRIYIGIVDSNFILQMSVQVSAASGSVLLGPIASEGTGFRVVGFDSRMIGFVWSAAFPVTSTASAPGGNSVDDGASDSNEADAATSFELEVARDAGVSGSTIPVVSIQLPPWFADGDGNENGSGGDDEGGSGGEEQQPGEGASDGGRQQDGAATSADDNVDTDDVTTSLNSAAIAKQQQRHQSLHPITLPAW